MRQNWRELGTAVFEARFLFGVLLATQTSPPATTGRKELEGIVLFQHFSGTAHSGTVSAKALRAIRGRL